MGIMIFMLKSQRRALRWPNNLCARLYFIGTIVVAKINCQNIQPAHSMITERDFILRGSYFFASFKSGYKCPTSHMTLPTFLADSRGGKASITIFSDKWSVATHFPSSCPNILYTPI